MTLIITSDHFRGSPDAASSCFVYCGQLTVIIICSICVGNACVYNYTRIGPCYPHNALKRVYVISRVRHVSEEKISVVQLVFNWDYI